MGQNEYIDESLRSFLLKLGGRTPEPAGGAALALAGASAAALLSLACHSGARDRKGASEAGDRIRTAQSRAEELSDRMQALIDADVYAYREVTRALRLPRDTDKDLQTRGKRLDSALRAATEVPLQLAEAGLEILTVAAQVIDLVRGPVLGDLAAAVHLAEAVVKGSLRNAHINCSAMSDRDYSRATEAQIARIRKEFQQAAQSLTSAFAERGLPG
ncbi:MAG: cyclodeaminase/cyclohydrolase family protein [Thermoleophilia bacterium]